MTNQEMISDKIEALKGNVSDLWSKFSDDNFRLPRTKFQKVKTRVKSLLQSERKTSSSPEDKEEFRFNENTEEDLPLTIHHDWDGVNANASLAKDHLLTADEAEDYGADGILDRQEAEEVMRRGAGKKSGVKYAATENNPLARGSDKYESGGIDSFN